MITDAISLSGGLTEDAHKGGVNVSRNGKVHETDLRALYDFADVNQICHQWEKCTTFGKVPIFSVELSSKCPIERC